MSSFKVPYSVDEEKEAELGANCPSGILALFTDAMSLAQKSEVLKISSCGYESGLFDCEGIGKNGEFLLTICGHYLIFVVEDGDEEAVIELFKQAEITERSAVSIDWDNKCETVYRDWCVLNLLQRRGRHY